MMVYKLILMAFLSFLFLKGKAQQFDNYIKEIITTKEGLPGNEVYHIIQDNDKCLWFTTDNGIVKYDGKKFKVFNSNDGLPNNTVFRLYLQPDGAIYGEANFGKFFSIKNDSIFPYPYNHVIEKYISHNYQCYSFYKDENSIIHIGSKEGYLAIDKNGKVIDKDFYVEGKKTSFSLKFKKFPNYVFSYRSMKSEDKTIYPLVQVNANNELYTYKNSGLKAYPQSDYSTYIPNDRIAIIHSGSVYILNNTEVTQILNFETTPIGVSCFESLLWIGTANSGVYCFEVGKDSIILKDHFLQGYSVTHALKDHEDGYWFSTRELGVVHYSNYNVVKVFESQTNQNISSFYLDKTNSLVGFENGIVKRTTNSSVICNLTNSITNISKLNADYLFFCDGAIINYAVAKNRVSFSNLIRRSKKEFANGLQQLNDSLLILHNTSYFNIYNTKKSQSIFSSNSKDFKARISVVKILNDEIILGTTKGLILFDKQNFSLKENIELPSPVTALMTNGNELYVACKNGSIFHIKSRKATLQIFKRSKLSVVYDALITENKMIVATNFGVCKYVFDKTSNEWVINETIPISGVVKIYNYENSIYYQTKKEIYKDLNKKHKNPSPATKITSIKINGTIVQADYLNNLNHYQNNVLFTVNAVTFSSQFQNFKYQLIGHDKEVLYTTQSEINYSSLPAGEYIFKISSSANGVDYSEEQVISFIINPPFWRATWFIVLVILAFIAILAIIYVRQLNKLKTKLELDKTIAELKSKALTSQLNPHLVFNILNSIQGTISEGEIEKANIYLARFSKFMRSSLKLSKNTTIPISDEIEITNSYIALEMLRFPEGLSISIVNNLSNATLRVPPLILQPFIENAIKHGIMPSKNKSGLIEINLREENNVFYITITDNGTGFNKPIDFNDGDGMRISKERLEIINPENSITLDTAKEKTTIVIKILQ